MLMVDRSIVPVHADAPLGMIDSQHVRKDLITMASGPIKRVNSVQFNVYHLADE
jgi:hypothetical protein